MGKSFIILFFIIAGLVSFAQENETIHAKTFVIPEYNDKNELVCVIKGESGKIYGKEAIIKQAEVEIHNKKNPLLIKTPECKYLLEHKRATSREVVDIRGNGIVITGKGFDIDNVEKKILIRSEVKVIWTRKIAPKPTTENSTEKPKKEVTP